MMIPFAILSGQLTFNDHTTLEFRILDLSTAGFTFRLSKKHHKQMITGIRLSFYDFDKDHFIPCSLSDFTVNIERPDASSDFEDFYTLYRVESADADYIRLTEQLTASYMRYIQLKLSGDDAALSEILTGYPSAQEDIYPESIEDFRRIHLSGRKKSDACLLPLPLGSGEIALSLMTAPLMEAFLQMSFSDFKEMITRDYFKDMILVNTLKITHVYLGHPVSLKLYPDASSIDAAIKKAHRLGLLPVIVIPPLRGRQFDTMIERLQNWLPSLTDAYASRDRCPEFLINDWGMAKYLHDHLHEQCHLTLGTLLNKRRKDVRMSYKNNPDRLKALLQENSSNADFYQRVLKKDYGIESFAYDTTAYVQQLPPGLHELHLPYYLMNTEGFAAPSIRLYPSFLPMIGIDGNLWGLDTDLFTDPAYQQAVISPSIRRIVLEVI